MTIKRNLETNMFDVSYAKRNPITGRPVDLKRKNIMTMAEAKRVEAELILKVHEKIKSQATPMWVQFVEQYVESLESTDVTRTTRYNREKILRYHTVEAWRSKYINEITTADIHKLLKERLGGNAESYQKFFIKCVRGVFNYAVEQGILHRNPTPMIKFKLKSTIKGVLTEQQILLLLHKAQEQCWPWYPHYSVALFTGLRNGELYALRWINIDLDGRRIIVNSSWSSKDGFKSTKSGNDRIVEIPKPLLPLLFELKLRSAESDFVLPRLNRWDRGEQAYDLRLFLKAIGLHEVRFHDLRASWATLLLSKGVAPSQVMAQGGWADMNTMMIYMRKAGIDIRNSTSVLDGLQTHGIAEGKILELC